MSKTILVGLLSLALLTACSKIMPKLDQVLPDKRTEYKKSKTLPDLEVPPDLTTDAIRDRMAIPNAGDGEAATFSTYQEREAERKRSQELERSESGAIKLLENEHILAVEGVISQIWPQLRDFWTNLGYGLDLDDEELGVVETTWNENQEELVRDKFKIFGEPGQEPGTTLLYISHRGEELVSQGDELGWQARERDIALERNVVESIQEHLGGLAAAESDSSNAAVEVERTASRAELVSAGGGKVYTSLTEEFGSAWESTGAALEKAGIEIKQQDRERGVFLINLPAGENKQSKSGLAKLKFWGSDNTELQLSLTGVGEKTEIVVLDKEGKWETSDLASKLLTRLNDQFNAES